MQEFIYIYYIYDIIILHDNVQAILFGWEINAYDASNVLLSRSFCTKCFIFIQ